jgi:transcriptional regulator with XRE-family HTH domain
MNAIKTEYESGKTQEEIARKHNISQVIVNRLLSGKRSVGGLTLNTVCKMFPRIRSISTAEIARSLSLTTILLLLISIAIIFLTEIFQSTVGR